MQALRSHLVKLDTACGSATVDARRVRALSPPAARKVIRVLINHIGGTRRTHYQALEKVYNLFLHPLQRRAETCGQCQAFSLDGDTVLVARCRPLKHERTLTPVKVGETVVWDNRFAISLVPLETPPTTTPQKSPPPGKPAKSRRKKSQETVSEANQDQRQFYVRHMVPTDWGLAQEGVRRVKRAQLPHERVRGGLPVVVDEEGKVVEIPHFKMVDRRRGVMAVIRFEPQVKLEELLPCPPDKPHSLKGLL